jgi:hypothetical protein
LVPQAAQQESGKGDGRADSVENDLGGREDHETEVLRGEPEDGEGEIEANPVGKDLGDLGGGVDFGILIHWDDEVGAALGLLR